MSTAGSRLILVTGGTGLVGSAVVRRLVAAGDSVRVLCRTSSQIDLLGEAAQSVEFVVGDLTDPLSVDDAVQGASHVIHAAAALDAGGRRPRHLDAVNVRGTAHVVNSALAAGVERAIHISSIAALGRPTHDGATLDESAQWRETPATTNYARSKHRAELEMQRGVAEGLDAVIINPALVFGPGRTGENTMRIAEGLKNKRFPAAPPGGTGVVDVDDVATGLIAALENGTPGRRYILCAENLSWRSIFARLAEALGVEPPTRTLPPRLTIAAGTLAAWVGRLPGVPTLFSRDLALTASRTTCYNGSRAVRELDITYRPFEATARRVAEAVRDQ